MILWPYKKKNRMKTIHFLLRWKMTLPFMMTRPTTLNSTRANFCKRFMTRILTLFGRPMRATISLLNKGPRTISSSNLLLKDMNLRIYHRHRMMKLKRRKKNNWRKISSHRLNSSKCSNNSHFNKKIKRLHKMKWKFLILIQKIKKNNNKRKISKVLVLLIVKNSKWNHKSFTNQMPPIKITKKNLKTSLKMMTIIPQQLPNLKNLRSLS